MKTIDIKSLLIGGLLASTILLGMAAVPYNTGRNKTANSGWDDKQDWHVIALDQIPNRNQRGFGDSGYQPFAVSDKRIFYRQRQK